ncbi:hypothetical protein D9M71_827390 [compost metagenome]
MPMVRQVSLTSYSPRRMSAKPTCGVSLVPSSMNRIPMAHSECEEFDANGHSPLTRQPPDSGVAVPWGLAKIEAMRTGPSANTSSRTSSE